LTEEIHKAKDEHEQKLATKIKDSLGKNEKLWWRLTKNFYNKTKNNKHQTPPLVHDGVPTSSNLEKANTFNNYFAKICSLDGDEGENDLPEFQVPEEMLENIPFQTTTVKEILQQLDVSKATGPDNIGARLLREVAAEIAPSLARIYNFSMQTGTFPTLWKTANITPIYKKGSKTEAKNYRPVSLLSIPGKVMERCIHKQLYDFLIGNKILSPKQSAFKRNNSTVTQLIEIYNSVLLSLDEGKEVLFTFCDVSKAFDRVWHHGIIYKLRRAGVKGRLINWFQAYLNDRIQKTVVNGKTSEAKTIEAGVPQGSILGPLLFLLYMDDLIQQVNIEVRLYADDATLYISYDDAEQASIEMDDNLTAVMNWANQWKVLFNPEKTVCMNITRKRNPGNPTVRMSNTEVHQVPAHKHLGVTLQNNTKWSIHIDDLVCRASKRIDILRGLMWKVDRRSLNKLYMTYVRPILEIGGCVWVNCTKIENEKLEKKQIEAARVVTGAKKGTSHHELYRETGWQTLAARRTNQCLVLLFRMMRNEAAEQLTALVPERTGNRAEYNIRSGNNLTVPRSRSTAHQNSFLPSTCREWNKLPLSHKQINSVEGFKEKLREEVVKVPSYLHVGERKLQILHCRLRVKNADLNGNLYSKQMKESPECECGEAVETTKHYFMECPLYDQDRARLAMSIPDGIDATTDILLSGDPSLTEDANAGLFKATQEYIRATGRFE
jgi:hypothetical protein